MTIKSYEEINQKIKAGKAVVLTAEEVAEMGRTASPAEIVKKVDVVTTATFGAMCSSGAIINFGHANPPIRMEKIGSTGCPATKGWPLLMPISAPLPAILKSRNMVAPM